MTDTEALHLHPIGRNKFTGSNLPICHNLKKRNFSLVNPRCLFLFNIIPMLLKYYSRKRAFG